MAGPRIEAATRRLNATIVDRPRTVVAVFLVLTVLFVGGFGLISTETDSTDSFTDDLPEQQALDAVNEEFEDPFQADGGETLLIHTGENVLTKRALVRNMRVIERVEAREDLRLASGPQAVVGLAPIVAQRIDPSATTAAEQRRVLEQASRSEIRQTVRSIGGGSVSTDYNPNGPAASASIKSLSHDVPSGFSSDDLTAIQTDIASIASDEPGDIRAFGPGITNAEMGNVISDSLTIVMPVVVVLLLGFLTVAYRDPIDLALGLLPCLLNATGTHPLMGRTGSGTNTTGHLPIMGNSRVHLTNPASANP